MKSLRGRRSSSKHEFKVMLKSSRSQFERQSAPQEFRSQPLASSSSEMRAERRAGITGEGGPVIDPRIPKGCRYGMQNL